MNRIQIVGRMVKEPELNVGSSGVSKVRFTIASHRNYKSKSGEFETDFIPCVAWRQLAERINKTLTKGDLVCCYGSLEHRRYKDAKGEYATFTTVVVDGIEQLSFRRYEGGKAPAEATAAPSAGEQGGFEDYEMDDAEIPF